MQNKCYHANVISLSQNSKLSQHCSQAVMHKICYDVNVFKIYKFKNYQFSQHRPQEVMQ